MTCVLGVDGGNSKTLAVLMDRQGNVAGVGRAGGSNHQSAGGTVPAMTEIRVAVERALVMAGLQPTEIDAAAYCLAGADLPEDFAMLDPAVRALGFTTQTYLDNDSVALLRSGTDLPDAVAVVWGAGTNAVGRNAAGESIRLPALGWISGDWGGGSDLGREAVSLVARAHDGRGQATMLTELVLRALQVADVDAMIQALYHWEQQSGTGKQRDFAPHHLAPLVFQAAESGDGVARDLVKMAGTEIAVAAIALLHRLHLLERPADVVLGGSIFKAEGTLLMDAVRRRISEGAPLARPTLPMHEPVIGAAFCAMDLLGLPVDDTTHERAGASYQAHMRGTAVERHR